jgi:ribonucleoside-triphosphate reductase
MKNDYEKMDKAHKEYQNSFGVGGISIGSTRVSGLNLPRIAFEARRDNPNRSNFEKFDISKYIEKYMGMCRKVLTAHRVLLNNHIEAGALPLYTSGWIDIDKQYITYGFIGAYELLDILGMDITTNRGSDYLVGVLNTMENLSDKWSFEDKLISNIEAIPGESIAYRLSNIDKELGYNKDYSVDLYSNQYLPLIKEASIYDRFKIQGKLDKLTSGGSILHLNIHDGADLSSAHVKKLINAALKSGTTYFAVNRVFVKCENDHMTISNNGACPICKGKIVEMFTRVVGFVVSVDSWSPLRQEKDFPHRVFYRKEDSFFS